jgi:hypothetical protein
MKVPEPEELHELVLKCWMTHDGMWFMHCLKELGIETTNRLNKAAGRSLAGIEIKRIRESFDLGAIDSFEKLKALIRAALSSLVGDFMDFAWTFPRENVLLVEAGRCFALEGMKRLGVAEQYECGIFSRVEGWFEALGLNFEVNPKIPGCVMLKQGQCRREYTFIFDSKPKPRTEEIR